MALKKQLNFAARGLSGGYIKISSYRWDDVTRESSATVSLFRDEAHAKTPGAVPLATIAKVRLNAEKFDAYFGKTVLDKLGKTRDPIRAQFYKAAKAGDGVICDAGPLAFADADSDEN